MSLLDELAGVLELGNPAWMHERRDPHTGEWIKTPGDVSFPMPEPGPAGSVHRYKVPDPRRLFTRSGYRNPADHPFFREHPVSPKNIIDAYDEVPEGVRAQGARWYSDVHDMATKMTGGNPEMGGILLSTYSPRNNWPGNMFNAARTYDNQKPIGPKDGAFVTGAMMTKAQRALDGEGIDKLMITGKTHSFGALIKYGDDLPEDPYGHVVVDTHALNVAAGGTVRGQAMEKAPINDQRLHEYVGDQFREAAKMISERDGALMKPHQLQAITWLGQKLVNDANDAWIAEHGGPKEKGLKKGQLANVANNWKKWMSYAEEHGIPVEGGTTSLAAELLAAQVTELAGPGTLLAALLESRPSDGLAADLIDLAFNPDQPRGRDGRWISGTGGLAGQLAERERQYQATKAGRIERRAAGGREYPVIGPEHARGNSRPVSREEFQALARQGNSWIDKAKNHSEPITGLEGANWDRVKDRSYAEAQRSWGGETIDTNTGQPLPQGADKYAISVKPRGMTTVSVPQDASRAEFGAAMDRAKQLFRPALERRSFYLGVFHDDDNSRIDIDPVAIVDTPELVEQVGSYTRAVGGAYHFKSGDGFWPPHVAEGASMAGDEDRIHFAGIGQWHAQAVAVQEPEPDEDDAAQE